MNFELYANLAKAKNKINSNNKLAKAVGVSGAAMNFFINKKASPSPDTVLKLATLAGIDEKQAMLDFAIDRFSKYPEVKKTFEDIKNLTLKS